MTDLSLKEIGRHFGERDHATVLHSIKTIRDLIQFEPMFIETVTKLEHKLENGLIKMDY